MLHFPSLTKSRTETEQRDSSNESRMVIYVCSVVIPEPAVILGAGWRFSNTKEYKVKLFAVRVVWTNEPEDAFLKIEGSGWWTKIEAACQ